MKICCKRVCYVQARLYDNTLLWGSKHCGIWVSGTNVYAHVKALFNAHNMCRCEAESKWAAPAKCRMTWKHLDITEVRDVWFVAKKNNYKMKQSTRIWNWCRTPVKPMTEKNVDRNLDKPTLQPNWTKTEEENKRFMHCLRFTLVLGSTWLCMNDELLQIPLLKVGCSGLERHRHICVELSMTITDDWKQWMMCRGV